MSEIPNEKIEISEEGKVIIRKEAFKNILIHILEFGNIYLDYSTQAMGFCIGNINSKGNIIEVVNTIPITHGDNIEIGFSENDRVALQKIQKLYPNQVIGWYHSHPSFDLFFSKVDKVSNLYFQTEQNPYGFGIVVDPSKIKKDKSFGLDVYRLKDLKLGAHSSYIRVRYEIEFPDSLDYFKWIQSFVEESQMKTPILIQEQTEIKEHSHLELQEIPTSKELIREQYPKPSQKYTEPSITGLKEGTKPISESIIDNYRSELTAWEREFNQGTVQSTNKIQTSLKQMGLTVSDGLGKVENFIDKNFKKRINEFNNEIYSYINQRVKKNNELKNNISNIKETLTNSFINKVDETITQIYEELKGNLDAVTNQISDIYKKNLIIEENILKSNEIISRFSNQIKDDSVNINKSIDTIAHSFESNLLEEYNRIISEVEPLQENHSEIKSLIEKFQKIISNLRNIKT